MSQGNEKPSSLPWGASLVALEVEGIANPKPQNKQMWLLGSPHDLN